MDLVLSRRGLRYRGRFLPCTIGRGGLRSDKREGDGATPTGVHKITGLMYRPDRMRPPADWAVPILPGDLWSDDSQDPNYNHLARAPHAYGHETLRRADPMYDIVLLTDWNWPIASKDRGSAIFLHIWRGPLHPTAGCIAFSRESLLWILQTLRPCARLIIPEHLI